MADLRENLQDVDVLHFPLLSAGKSLEELQKSIRLPDSVRLHVGNWFESQVAKVYSEKTTP